jgi:hypothetical protein
MKLALKLVLLFFIYSILFILPAILIPLGVQMEDQSKYNTLMIFLLLVSQLLTLVYLVRRLDLSGMKLFLAVVMVFWGLQTFMTQLETWYFREAMPEITDQELVNLFLRPLITTVLFVPVAMWVLARWKALPGASQGHSPIAMTWKELLALSLSYVVIYFLFGYLVAWRFEEVRVFYSGSPEDAGFIGQMKFTLQGRPFIFLFQLLRGFLWIVMGLPVLLYLRGDKNEKIVACVILYSVAALQLIVDNPFMPQQVRIAHLLEVGSSNALFGWLIGWVSTHKRKEPLLRKP